MEGAECCVDSGSCYGRTAAPTWRCCNRSFRDDVATVAVMKDAGWLPRSLERAEARFDKRLADDPPTAEMWLVVQAHARSAAKAAVRQAAKDSSQKVSANLNNPPQNPAQLQAGSGADFNGLAALAGALDKLNLAGPVPGHSPGLCGHRSRGSGGRDDRRCHLLTPLSVGGGRLPTRSDGPHQARDDSATENP